MTLLFQKSNICSNFNNFLEVSQLLIANYFFNVTNYRLGADYKIAFAVETKRCVSVRNLFEITLPFWYYRRVTLDWLLMLNFQPIKTVCVQE